MSTTELDCRGLACPEPVMRCRKVVNEAHPPILNVVVDNAAARENVSRFLEKKGYAVVSAPMGNDLWNVRGTTEGLSDVGAEEAESGGVSSRKTAVLITTEFLGSGDDELGEKLMGNFLAALPELGASLWRIILLNGGVKLAVKPGKALDSLTKLESAGVTVLVCGACLTHYGLLEVKRVGETTNMLDVLTSLDLADKIIRP